MTINYNVIVSVADTRTVTRTQAHPRTRDRHSLALAEARLARRTGSEAETAGMTGRSQAGEMIAPPRGQTVIFSVNESHQYFFFSA